MSACVVSCATRCSPSPSPRSSSRRTPVPSGRRFVTIRLERRPRPVRARSPSRPRTGKSTWVDRSGPTRTWASTWTRTARSMSSTSRAERSSRSSPTIDWCGNRRRWSSARCTVWSISTATVGSKWSRRRRVTCSCSRATRARCCGSSPTARSATSAACASAISTATASPATKSNGVVITAPVTPDGGIGDTSFTPDGDLDATIDSGSDGGAPSIGPNDDSSSGCGCRTGAGAGEATALGLGALAIGLVLVRRRARK